MIAARAPAYVEFPVTGIMMSMRILCVILVKEREGKRLIGVLEYRIDTVNKCESKD